MHASGVIAALMACLTALTGVVALADSWEPPSRETYFSKDQSVRFTATPRNIGSSLAYFEEEKVARCDGQDARPSACAHGMLERRNERGEWVVVWERLLLNDVAPVSALVADQGRYVVTFDDWHFVGTREHVVVIYGAGGALIRSLSLAEILPEFYIKALPRSVSSIGWGGEHEIEGGRLILNILVPSEDRWSWQRRYADLAVELSSGRILNSDGSDWRDAIDQARRVAAIRQAEVDAAAARFVAPLVAPTSSDEGEWHRYLRDAYARLDADWPERHPGVAVLRAPTAEDYTGSQEWLCRLLVGQLRGGNTIVASPASPGNLARALSACSGQAEAGSLAGARIYVVVPREYREGAVAALAPTGAQVIWVDPTVPIPQRRGLLERVNASRPPQSQ